MTHREKVDLLISELTAKGVKPKLIAPPLYRWLWGLGFETPLPLFGVSLGVMFLVALFAALGMGLVYWVSGRPDFLPRASLFGGAFALLMWPIFYFQFRWKAKRLGLASWEDYARVADASNPVKKVRSDPGI